jgi:hypothetical protein
LTLESSQFDNIYLKLVLGDELYLYYFDFEIKWKPLNVITLGEQESDNINQMISISILLLTQNNQYMISWDWVSLSQIDRITE